MQVSQDNSSNKSINKSQNINELIKPNDIEVDYINSQQDEVITINNDESDVEIDLEYIDKLVSDKNVLQSQIYNFYRLIKNNQNDIEALEKTIFKLCNHEWILDESASFDDRCKHLCAKCSLYNSPFMYG